MKSRYQPLLAAVLGTGLAFSSAVWAIDDPVVIQEMADTFGLISLEQAREIALETKPGFVKDVELEPIKNGGGWKYEIEVYDKNGMEWDIYIHAKTGEVLRVKLDD